MPRIGFWRRHVSGFPEVGIWVGNLLKMWVLPNIKEVRKLYGKREITDEQLDFLEKQKSYVRSCFSNPDACGVDGCPNEMNGTDRDVPLCEEHWEEQERIYERWDAKGYWHEDEIRKKYPGRKYEQDLSKILFGE